MVGPLRGGGGNPQTTKQKSKMLFNEVRQFYIIKFVCGYYYWYEKNKCQKKSGTFSPKIGEKICQNPFQAILRQKKKWHGPLSH